MRLLILLVALSTYQLTAQDLYMPRDIKQAYKKETRSMRSKEDSQDYRYFPDPDLPPLVIGAEWVERIRATMPELPGAMRERFVQDYALSEYDAVSLTQSQAMAAYFEAVVTAVVRKY